MLRLTVDGTELCVAPGSTLLEACRAAGADVPTLCHDERIAASGACRLCIVEVAGEARPVAACTTPAVDGMTVATHTSAVEALRTTLLRMLVRDYPPDAVATFPEEPFHRLLRRYGVERDAAGRADPAMQDASHPCIDVDLSRCISCWRCVRICEEMQGQFVWRVAGRGAASHIVPDAATLVASSCVACGACVDTCPTGALEDHSVVEAGIPTRWTRTTCPYCGVGCELQVGTRDGAITTIEPARDAPVNRGHACVKGRYAHGFVSAPDRATRPMIREGDKWRTVSWDAAFDAVAAGLRRVLDRDGPDSVGVLGSARATNEDNYLLQKFARTVLRTNNVDCCARVCHAPSAAALGSMLGTGAATNSFADIEAAGTLLVCGANATESHPVIGARIKQAKLRGATLIVVDARRVELAEYADLHLQVRPGTDVLVLDAMAAVILEEGLLDDEFVRERVEDVEELRRFLASFSPEDVAATCGVDPARIRDAARLYATNKPSMSLHGLGLTEHRQGTEAVMCLVDLALLTGNLGRPGSGVNPLRGQNNVQGAAHMGCEPGHLPGYAPLADAAASVEQVWGAAVPTTPGLDVMEMLDAAEAGTLRALWTVGWDILLTQPDTNVTRRALANLELLVVEDLFLNETAAAFATVFLPACSAYEKDGTFMNGERRVQRVRRVLEPRGESRPDWEIVCGVAVAMGHPDGFDFHGAGDVWDEIRSVWPAGAGITDERLDRPGGVQWPCPSADHPGTEILHTTSFPGIGPRARLRSVAYEASPEQPDAQFPLVLVTGRNLYQFNAGTMTGRAVTRRLRPTDLLEMCADDAGAFGIEDGGRVRVCSRYGEAVLPVVVTDRVARGSVFATFNDPAVHLNRLTGSQRDAITHTPEYKVTAVRVEALPPSTPSGPM